MGKDTNDFPIFETAVSGVCLYCRDPAKYEKKHGGITIRCCEKESCKLAASNEAGMTDRWKDR